MLPFVVFFPSSAESVTAIVAPTPVVDIVYLVLKTGSSSTIRQYNVTSYMRTLVETRQNVTETVDEHNNITVINHGDYNVTIFEIVPSIIRVPAAQVCAWWLDWLFPCYIS